MRQGRFDLWKWYVLERNKSFVAQDNLLTVIFSEHYSAWQRGSQPKKMVEEIPSPLYIVNLYCLNRNK